MKKPLSPEPLVTVRIPTTDGEFVAHYSDRGLAALDFPKRDSATARAARQKIAAAALPPRIGEWHRQTVAALQAVLSGEEPVALPPLDLSNGTKFQQKVWQAMVEIKSGQTRSYSELARLMGKPGATRAIGNACGANPIPVLIPCHRVLAGGGKLGGFSGGLDWKRLLLGREGRQF